jgi:mono/diheme cytochrome c family protein
MTIARSFQYEYLSFITLAISIACVGFLISSGLVLAAEANEEKFFEEEKLTISDDPIVNTGWQVYQVKCAVCHGSKGLGDGLMEEVLIKKPSDLTQISKRAGGDFPYWELYKIIDGQSALLAHGTREMPIWGKEFAKEAAGMSPESLIRLRIKALITYIESIQE